MPRRLQVIAHRGASAAAPENTIAAFELAGRLGADAVELDVRRTADDVLVVRHDAHLDDGTPLIDVTRADLPITIPVLEDALAACRGMWVNVEVKNDPREPDFDADRTLATRVADVLRATDADDRWVVSSFDLDLVDAVARYAPGLPTAWLVLEIDADTAAQMRAGGHRAVHPWVASLTRSQVEELHAAGIAVNAWTCNDAERLAELVAWGVDGCCTDVVDVARAVVDSAAPPDGAPAGLSR